jgi:hypothetical protein
MYSSIFTSISYNKINYKRKLHKAYLMVILYENLHDSTLMNSCKLLWYLSLIHSISHLCLCLSLPSSCSYHLYQQYLISYYFDFSFLNLKDSFQQHLSTQVGLFYSSYAYPFLCLVCSIKMIASISILLKLIQVLMTCE